MHGVHLRMCISLGALREDRIKISASWAAMDFKRLMAVSRYYYHYYYFFYFFFIFFIIIIIYSIK